MFTNLFFIEDTLHFLDLHGWCTGSRSVDEIEIGGGIIVEACDRNICGVVLGSDEV